jgi:hypothetical protein
MPHFIGIAGQYQEERATKRRVNAVIGMMVALCIVEAGLGYAIGNRGLWVMVVAVAIAVPMLWYLSRRFDQIIRQARMEETGAEGERSIVPCLKKLPDTYTVVCDLDFADSYGNIDHLVIGPTGIFSIDVKNWKGTVAADGRGELLLNGKPTDKPQVRAFTARTMDLKERLKALTRLDPYIQCLFVFPHTYLEARWGTTGTVLCVDVDNLVSLITKPNPTRAIPPADLPRLVSAAKALKETITIPQKPPRELEEQKSG